MDLTLSADQRELVGALDTLFGRHAGAARARELGDTLDRPLLERLEREGFVDVAKADGAGLLDAVLLVEQAERAYARAPVAARTLVAAALPAVPGLAIGLVSGPASFVRYAGQCDTYLFLDNDDVLVAPAADVEVEPVPSRWGYPLGRVRSERADRLDVDGRPAGPRLRAAWQVALAAEMGAQMTRAISLTARYVSERKQFGKAIGSYQAVSHRLANADVFAQGTTWMARRASWNLDDLPIAAAAATYACEAGRNVIEATHQVTGAIGLTREYDLVLSTMRLGVLLTELGGGAAHAQSVVRTRWLC